MWRARGDIIERKWREKEMERNEHEEEGKREERRDRRIPRQGGKFSPDPDELHGVSFPF